MNSMNMISITGRSPVAAAPTAAPRKPISDIGVSRTRRGPNDSSSPAEVLKGPFGRRDVPRRT